MQLNQFYHSAFSKLGSVPELRPTTRPKVSGTTTHRLLCFRDSDMPRLVQSRARDALSRVSIPNPETNPLEGAFRLSGRVGKFIAFISAGFNTLRWLSVEAWGSGKLPVHYCTSRSPLIVNLLRAVEGSSPVQVLLSYTAESPAPRPLCPVFSSSAAPGRSGTGSPCLLRWWGDIRPPLGVKSEVFRRREKRDPGAPDEAQLWCVAVHIPMKHFLPSPGPHGTSPEPISSPWSARGSGVDGDPLAECGSCTVSPKQPP